MTVTYLARQGGGTLLAQGSAAALNAQGPAFTGVDGAHLLLPGTASNNASTPHQAAHLPPGDFTVIVYAAADDWTPAADTTIASKYVSQANGAWRLYLDASPTSGVLVLGVSIAGVADQALCTFTVQGVTGVADGAGVWLKAERTSLDGSVDFYYSFDPETTEPEAVTWTILQLNRAATSGVIGAGTTADTHIGGFNAGASQPFAGKVYRVAGYSSLTPVATDKLFDFNPGEWESGATWFSTETGETWTLNGTATIETTTTVTGTATPTLQAATSSASGAHGVSGTSATSIGNALSAAVGIVQVTGSIGATLGQALSAGAGGVGVAGTVARTLGNATSLASGGHGVAGTVAKSLSNATSAGVGYAQVTGTSAKSLAPAVSAGTGGVGVAGSVAASLGTATGSAQGTQTISGAASPTLGAATSTATGTHTPPSVTGTVAATLGAAVGSSAGSVRIEGTVARTLAAATSTASGAHGVSGSLSRTLGTATGSAVGTAFPPSTNGPVVATLANATSAATGAVGASGTVGRSLVNATATGSGTHVQPVSGASSVTLSPAFSTGIGRVQVTGTVAATLGNATSSAAGTGPATVQPSTGTGQPSRFPNFEPSTRHDQRLSASARSALRVEYDRTITHQLVAAADTWTEADADQVTDLDTALVGASRATVISNRRLNPATVLLAIA